MHRPQIHENSVDLAYFARFAVNIQLQITCFPMYLVIGAVSVRRRGALVYQFLVELFGGPLHSLPPCLAMLVDRSQVFRSLAQRRNGLFQFCFRQRDDLALLLQFLGQFSLLPFEVGEMRAALDQVVSLEPRRRRSRQMNLRGRRQGSAFVESLLSTKHLGSGGGQLLSSQSHHPRRLLAYLVAQFPNRLQSISLLHFSQAITRMAISVPWPGRLSRMSSPSIAAARSRIPSNPKCEFPSAADDSTSNPMPSSRTRNSTQFKANRNSTRR